MSLDHYISQIHLNKFCNPNNNMLYAVNKQSLKSFSCSPRNVCRTHDGNTNDYLKEPRHIEEFLKPIEANYSWAVEQIKKKEVCEKVISIIAGWIAYVLVCSPTAIRLSAEALRAISQETAIYLDREKCFAPFLAPLNGSLKHNLTTNKLEVKIDDLKYPQAIGIDNVLDIMHRLGNCDWMFLINTHEDSLFFTSDYPIAIEKTNNPYFCNKIIPLTPTIALRIIPNLHTTSENVTKNFSSNTWCIKNISRKEIIKINRLIVQSAENLVFFSKRGDWAEKFIKKNSEFLAKTKIEVIELSDDSTRIVLTPCIASYQQALTLKMLAPV